MACGLQRKKYFHYTDTLVFPPSANATPLYADSVPAWNIVCPHLKTNQTKGLAGIAWNETASYTYVELLQQSFMYSEATQILILW